MIIREALANDKPEIIYLYERSQAATGLPNPLIIPPAELGSRLYAHEAIKRYVATEAGKILGHGLIEPPNDEHTNKWRKALNDPAGKLIEIGGAFVDPDLSGRGIWTGLLLHHLTDIRTLSAAPVTATWTQNEHVKRVFKKHGGFYAGTQDTQQGVVDLFVFKQSSFSRLDR